MLLGLNPIRDRALFTTLYPILRDGLAFDLTSARALLESGDAAALAAMARPHSSGAWIWRYRDRQGRWSARPPK